MRLLIVDDDHALVGAAESALIGAGYDVATAETLTAARELADAQIFDGIVLDLVLPDGSGVDLLRELRKRGDQTPVLVLSGEADDAMIVLALDAGADDYVVKPISASHLLARVRALVRRHDVEPSREVVTVGNVSLNRLSQTLHCEGRSIAVTRKEFALLEYFMTRADALVTRKDLLEAVWGIQFEPGTNLVDVHMLRLRRILRDAGASVEVLTRRGRGFVLQQAAVTDVNS